MPDPAAESIRHRGWAVFPHSSASRAWAAAAHPRAAAAVADPALARWLRCEGTWFAGVDVLDNAADGSLGPVALAGPAINLAGALGWPVTDWHRAQVSVVYQGYPRPLAGESDAAFRFRRDRDGAHVDGLLPIGPERRRMLREPHAFILGLPLNRATAGASPLAIWEGSHRVMRAAFTRAFDRMPPQDWADTDVTAVYQAARRTAFDTCPRRLLHAAPGEAILLHRHTLHGISPWKIAAGSQPEGRMIAYFRPPMAITDWLTAP